MATLLYTNNSANPLFPDSFQNAFDNGTNFATYGGINRTTTGNSFWQGQYINLAAAPYSGFSIATLGMTKQAMSTVLAKITDTAGGEKPTAVIMNPGDYATLNNSITATENVFATVWAELPVQEPHPQLRVEQEQPVGSVLGHRPQHGFRFPDCVLGELACRDVVCGTGHCGDYRRMRPRYSSMKAGVLQCAVQQTA